eukprot:gene38552-biopygen25629
MKAIIVGGGVGGLTTALMLRARGIDCELYEQADAIRELGVGINTLPHAIRELAGLGLLDALDAVAIRTDELHYLNRHGQEVWREGRGHGAGHDVPQFSIHRGRLQSVIHKAVEQRLGTQAIHTGRRLGSFTQDEGGVTAHFADSRRGETGETERGDILVAADGIHSMVRAHYFPDQGPPRWNGVQMWRGACDWPVFLDGESMIVAGGMAGKLVREGVDGDFVGVADEKREGGDGKTTGAGGADDAAAAAGIAAHEDRDEGGEEGEDEEVEAVTVNDAGEDRDEERHEDAGAGVDEDGDDEGGEGGGRDVGERSGPGAVADEELGAAKGVVGPDEGEIDDDDEGEEAAADVGAERLGVFDADVDEGGEDHREHEEDAAEEGEAFVELGVTVFEQVATVLLKHLVLFGGNAFAGLDDGLAARDADRDGFQAAGGGGEAGLRGGAVENDIGGEAEAEDAEDGLGGGARDALGGEADAEEGERV